MRINVRSHRKVRKRFVLARLQQQDIPVKNWSFGRPTQTGIAEENCSGKIHIEHS